MLAVGVADSMLSAGENCLINVAAKIAMARPTPNQGARRVEERVGPSDDGLKSLLTGR